MRCASVTSKENNVRGTGYIYSTELLFFPLGNCKTDGFLRVSCKHCARHAGCLSPIPFAFQRKKLRRLIGCQPIYELRFSGPKSEQPSSAIQNTCSHIIAIYFCVRFHLFLMRYLVVYLPTLICFFCVFFLFA